MRQILRFEAGGASDREKKTVKRYSRGTTHDNQRNACPNTTGEISATNVRCCLGEVGEVEM